MAIPKGTEYTQKTNEEFIKAIKENHGILTRVADSLKLDISGVRERIRRNPELKQALEECRNNDLISLAHKGLYAALENGETWAIKLALEYMGREYGWWKSTESNVNLVGKVTTSQDMDLSKLSEEELKVMNDLLSKSRRIED